MTTDVRVLGETELTLFKELLAIFQDVFEISEHPIADRNYLEKILTSKECLIIVATVNGQIAGGLAAYILPNYFLAEPMAYIYDLGVKPEYQRQGVGKKIMGFFLNHCKERGIAEAFVQADAEDIHAIDFYRQLTPVKPTDAVQFTFKRIYTADQK